MAKQRIITPAGASFTVGSSDYSLEMEALANMDAEIIEAPMDTAGFIAAAATADAIYAKGIPITAEIIAALKNCKVISLGSVGVDSVDVKAATAAGIACHPLAVSHAFHSPAMAPMLQDFEQVLRQIRFSPPSRPLVSNVSGELAGPEIAQSDYWCDHVLSPVRFAQGMATLAAQGAVTFVELGAKPTLIGMGRQCLEGSAGTGTASSSSPLAWWPSLRPGFDDWQVMLRSLAELHRSGYPIDWQGFHRPFPHRLVALPGYPFQRQRYWWSRPGQGEAAASLWLGHILGEGPGSGVAAASLSPSPDSAAFSSASPSALASASASPSATDPATADTASLSWPGLEPLALPGGLERRYRTTLAPSSPADLGDHRIRRRHRPGQQFPPPQQFAVPVGRLAGEGPDSANKQFCHKKIPALLELLLTAAIRQPGQPVQDFGFVHGRDCHHLWIKAIRPGQHPRLRLRPHQLRDHIRIQHDHSGLNLPRFQGQSVKSLHYTDRLTPHEPNDHAAPAPLHR